MVQIVGNICKSHPDRAIVPFLLIIHVGLLLGGLRRNFVTVDEVGHIPSGLSYWQTGIYRAYRVNPPLTRMIAVLPVLAARPNTDYRHLNVDPRSRPEWDLGRDLIAANPDRYFNLVCLARLSGIAWSLLGAWIIYRWSFDLYGEASGCLGVAFWCFDPTVLSFAPLVTPDIPATVAGLGATYSFWHYLMRPSWPRVGWTALLLGITQLTKFSMLALYGIWPVIWLISQFGCQANPVKHSLPPWLKHGIVIIAVSVLVINLGYEFRGTGKSLGDFVFSSKLFAGNAPDGRAGTRPGAPENRFQNSWLGEVPVPFPEDYLGGIDLQRKDFEVGLPSYLAGQWRNRGWWYYYLYAFAVKEPIGTIIIILWALLLTAFRRTPGIVWSDALIPWLCAAMFLVFVSSQTGFNHHMRYILPSFPFLMIGASKLGCFLHSARTRGAALLLFALLSWSIVSSLAVYPHSMSYFNEVAGGPNRGHAHLVDSNIDWGQDLLNLRDWLGRHPEARPFGLAYFNAVDPRDFGIDFTLPPPGPDGSAAADLDSAVRFGPRPGYFAVSVNLLRGIISSVPNGSGGWFDTKRHNMYTYFQFFRPISRAGYSIYIYHITPEEADTVRREMGLPPLPPGTS